MVVRLVYCLFLLQGGMRSSILELYIDYADGDLKISEDSARNELEMYKVLFSPECESCFYDLFKKLFFDMRGRERKGVEDILIGLEFVQNSGATALWKYHLDVGAELEGFVREFDRLDVPEERDRLYCLAQA